MTTSEEAWAVMQAKIARLQRQDPEETAVSDEDFFRDGFTQMLKSFKSIAESGQATASQ